MRDTITKLKRLLTLWTQTPGCYTGCNIRILQVYGSAVTFYESYPHTQLTEAQMELLGWRVGVSHTTHSVHFSKSICLLSRWPFSDTFERWLLYILVSIQEKMIKEIYYFYLACMNVPKVSYVLRSSRSINEQIQVVPPSPSGSSLSGAPILWRF